MAIVRVTEFADVRNNMAYGSALRTQVRTTSATSAAITLGANTEFIRIDTDGIIAFAFDAAAVAAESARMPADTVEYFCIGTGHTVNVITAS